MQWWKTQIIIIISMRLLSQMRQGGYILHYATQHNIRILRPSSLFLTFPSRIVVVVVIAVVVVVVVVFVIVAATDPPWSFQVTLLSH